MKKIRYFSIKFTEVFVKVQKAVDYILKKGSYSPFFCPILLPLSVTEINMIDNYEGDV